MNMHYYIRIDKALLLIILIGAAGLVILGEKHQENKDIREKAAENERTIKILTKRLEKLEKKKKGDH